MNNLSLQRLLQCVPPDSFNLANSFLDEIESDRFDSITRHRTLTVLPIAMLPENKYPKKFLPPQHEFIQHVLSRPVLTSHEATPTFIQFANLLVNYIYKNIPLFAQAMAVRMDKGDSHYLIYSVIPSIFGFFISHDHTARAVVFYKAIMKIVPPEIASEILKPFFTSVITYRFIESVMYPFIYRFTSDPKIIKQISLKASLNSSSPIKIQSKAKSKIKSSKSYINDQNSHDFFSYFKHKARNSFSSDSSFSDIFSYAKMLCDLIIKSIPLLPIEALELIDFMYQRHWTQVEFNDFFFDNFFSYVSSLYICASPCLRADTIFKDVLNCLKSSSLLNPKFFHKAYYEGMSLFEMPPLYSMLDLPYLDFALTIADVAVATNAIENITELPPPLRGISYAKFSKDKFFKMFAVRSFVRKSQVSDLCLTMCPTQLANETTKKKKKKKSQGNENSPNENKNKNYVDNDDNFDCDDIEYQNGYYNLEINPKMRPKNADYSKEKLEMVVFNINKFEVEDNPEFERVFLQEHFSAENEEKTANDITIDLIEQIGPDACNFCSSNKKDDAKSDISTFSLENNEEVTKSSKPTKISFDSSSNESFNVIGDFIKGSTSNDDLTIGRLAKEMDSEPKEMLHETDSDHLINAKYSGSFMNISQMLNQDQSVEMINEPNPSAATAASSKKARKRFNSLLSFNSHGGLSMEESDDCFTHDGISNAFSSQMKVSATSACDVSVIPLDEIAKPSMNEKAEQKSEQNNNNNNNNSSSLRSSFAHEAPHDDDENSNKSSDERKKSKDWDLNVYLAKRRANLLIDQSHVFENYLRFRLASDQYASFTSLLTDFESIICAPLAMNLATLARQLDITVSNAYLGASKFFNTIQLKRLIFFIVLSRGPKKCLSSPTVVFNINECDNIVRAAIERLLKNFDLSCETNKLHRGEAELFWRAVEALQVMKSDIPVAMQIEAFYYVLNSLRKVEESIELRNEKSFQKINDQMPSKSHPQKVDQIPGVFNGGRNVLNFESLLFLAMLASGCQILLSRYVMFNFFVVKEKAHFLQILGSVGEANWSGFGEFFKHFLSLNEMGNLRKALVQLKAQLETVGKEM